MSYNEVSPDHYRGAAGIEAIDVIECWGLGYHLGSAMAYLLRLGKKPGASVETDLKKTLWYLDRFKQEISHDTDGDRYRGIQWPGPWDNEHPLVVGGAGAISAAFSLEGHVKGAVEAVLAMALYDDIDNDDDDHANRVLMEMLVTAIEHVAAAIDEVGA